MTDNAPRVLLRGDETGGHLAVVHLGGGGRPPLHRHDLGETFSILEGELTFQLDDERVTRRAGEIAFASTQGGAKREQDETPRERPRTHGITAG